MSTAIPLPHPAPDLPLHEVPTPCYVVDLGFLDANLRVLGDIQEQSGATILLALKGFAMWSVFDRIAKVLPGVTASSPDEARLGREKFGGEVHACAPAYSESDFETLLPLCDHIVFNSLAQWRRFAWTMSRRCALPRYSICAQRHPLNCAQRHPLKCPRPKAF